MENKKGSGVFLGVVSVATLIVAIIGATFAFFSTQTNSDEGVVNVSAYEFATTVTSVERVFPDEETNATALEQGLIPLNAQKSITTEVAEINTYLLHAVNTKKCVDDKGYMVCALYEVTLTNTSTSSAELNLEIKTNEISKFTDLTLQTLTALTPDYEAKPLRNDNGKAAKIATTPGDSITIYNNDNSEYTITVEGQSEKKFWFVVYLNEENEDTDQSEQMGGKFTGQLVFTTTNGSNRLTGTFSA